VPPRTRRGNTIMGRKQRGTRHLRFGMLSEDRLRLLRNITKYADEITSAFHCVCTAPPGDRESRRRELGSSNGSSAFILGQLRQLLTATICGWGRFDPKGNDGFVHELLASKSDVGRSHTRSDATQVFRDLKAGQIPLPSRPVGLGKVWVASGRAPTGLGVDNTASEPVATQESKLCMIYGVIDQTEAGILYLFAGRPVGRNSHAGLYRSDEILLFQLVVDVLHLGIDSRRAREWLQTQSEAALGVLDRLQLGVVVVNQRGEPLIVNHYAEKLIARGDGMAMGTGGLRAASEDETSELRTLLGAAAPGGERALVSAGQMRISRPAGGHPLIVRVSPLRATGSATRKGPPFAAVFICDPEQSGATTDETLHQLYGLTKAETQIALLLAQGTRLVEASRILGITTGTARTHAKRIFSKTATTGQVELVHLLLSHMVISPDVHVD